MRLLFIVLALILGFVGYKKITSKHIVSNISYSDSAGQTSTFELGMKPTLTSFWIEPCGYSDRVLKILNEIKALYPPDALDIVAFYANPIENGLLETIKKQKGLTYRLASLQQSIDIQQGLTKSFHGARMGGDIFLVNSKGEVTHVDAMKSGKTSADIKSEVLAALSRNVPSLRAITAEKQ